MIKSTALKSSQSSARRRGVNMSECRQLFSRRDAMLRHMRNLHTPLNENTPSLMLPQPPQQNHITQPQDSATYPQSHKPPSQLPSETTQALQVPQAALRNITDSFFFKHPFTSIISGPTSSGKTTFVKNLQQSNYN